MKSKTLFLLMFLCSCCSCCSSSSSAAAFFAGLIPSTGPHFRKVTGTGKLKLHIPLLELAKKITDGEPNARARTAKLEELRKTNPNDIKNFCGALQELRTKEKDSPYNGPGPFNILTTGGIKTAKELTWDWLTDGITKDDLFTVMSLCPRPSQ